MNENQKTRLESLGGAHATVGTTSKQLRVLAWNMEQVSELLAQEAPEVYARKVLPVLAEIGRQANDTARMVATPLLSRAPGRVRAGAGQLTQSEIADLLGVPVSIVRKWVQEGPLLAEDDSDER